MLRIPHIFTQDELLTTGQLLRAAKVRGHALSLDGLQKFHEHGLLVPLYRISDSAVPSHRIDVGTTGGGSNPRGWVLSAAGEGRLRDPAAEGYSPSQPYSMPADKQPEGWWNGYVYSSWQLLDVPDAINWYSWVREDDSINHLARVRPLNLTLAALAPRYLPGILGRLSIPPGMDRDDYWRYRAESDTQDLMRLAGFQPIDLQSAADNLLLIARHRDPIAKWLPLLRYASLSGWSKLTGEPLDAMWRRVAAELLLRAHEDLTASGDLPPLPDLDKEWHQPQHDRLTPRYPEAETLERALAEVGLSPHPRVILLVEGQTEQLHASRLLTELGLRDPQQVRVQCLQGADVNPQLIARYGITPRIGRRLADAWLLDATPTALVIAMDPENRWATAEKRTAQRRKLQLAVREEVRAQGADISQDELDFLIRVQVWGDHSYELANFTDDELIAGISELAAGRSALDPTSSLWQREVRQALQEARQQHDDIKVALGKLGVRTDKVALAELLWPRLQAKCEIELSERAIETPLLKVVTEVRDLVARLTGTFSLSVPPNFDEN